MYAAFLCALQSLFLPSHLSFMWTFRILELCYFVASQLGFVVILAMHVIDGKTFYCHHKMKPVHVALAISQMLLLCGSGDTNRGSSYFIFSFSLGSSKLLGVSSCLWASLQVNLHWSLDVLGRSQPNNFWLGQCYWLQRVCQGPQELPMYPGTLPGHEQQTHPPQTLGTLQIARLVAAWHLGAYACGYHVVSPVKATALSGVCINFPYSLLRWEKSTSVVC